MIKDWICLTEKRATLTLYIQPGAKKTEIAGTHGGALKIRLSAPPVDGKANIALIDFLAKQLGVAKSNILLKNGAASRNKVLEIAAPPPDIRDRLK